MYEFDLLEDTTAGSVESFVFGTFHGTAFVNASAILAGTLANDIAFVFDDTYGRCNKLLHNRQLFGLK